MKDGMQLRPMVKDTHMLDGSSNSSGSSYRCSSWLTGSHDCLECVLRRNTVGLLRVGRKLVDGGARCGRVTSVVGIPSKMSQALSSFPTLAVAVLAEWRFRLGGAVLSALP